MRSLSEKLLLSNALFERAARRLSCRGPLWGIKKRYRCKATVPTSKSRESEAAAVNGQWSKSAFICEICLKKLSTINYQLSTII
jgi:hypothetical protein